MKCPSFLVMRSSLFCVVLYGDYGLVLPSWRLGRFLEKWAISSASLPTPFLRVFNRLPSVLLSIVVVHVVRSWNAPIFRMHA